MKLQDLIVELKNHVSKEECKTFIDWFWNNKNIHTEGKVYNVANPESVVNLEAKIATQAYPNPSDPISHLISRIVFSGYEKYSNIKPTPQGLGGLCATAYSIRVYPKGIGKFLPHADQSAGGNVTRLFAFILYLNDVDEGGETEFPDFNYKCKPEEGKLLIFPCNYLFRHQGNTPISDDKYIVTAFINFVERYD